MTDRRPDDPVLEALAELEAVLLRTTELSRVALSRAEVIRALREKGHPFSEIIPMEERPLIIELLTESLREISDASSRFRKAEAQALYNEGLTMSQIASLFGVTRQRVAALLRGNEE